MPVRLKNSTTGAGSDSGKKPVCVQAPLSCGEGTVGCTQGDNEETDAVLHHTSCFGSPGIRNCSKFARPMNTGQTSPCPCYWELCDLKCEFFSVSFVGKIPSELLKYIQYQTFVLPTLYELGPRCIWEQSTIRDVTHFWYEVMKYIKDSVQWWDCIMRVIGIRLHRKVLHYRNVRNWRYFGE